MIIEGHNLNEEQINRVRKMAKSANIDVDFLNLMSDDASGGYIEIRSPCGNERLKIDNMNKRTFRSKLSAVSCDVQV